MSMKSILSRNYHSLDAGERAALCIRASARKDSVEFQRLCSTAERQNWSIPEHTPMVKAMAFLATCFQAEQLGYASTYWFTVAQSTPRMGEDAIDHPEDAPDENDSSKAGTGERGPKGLEPEFTASMAAFYYCLNRDAWAQFCEELGIEPSDLGTRSELMLDVCDELLPDIVPSRQELAAMVSARRPTDAPPFGEEDLRKVEDVLEDWRGFYNGITATE